MSILMFPTVSRWSDARSIHASACVGESRTSLVVGRNVWRSFGVALLWALALEIDERVATRTGEQVCRACGGSKHVDRWGRRPFLMSSTPWSVRPIPSPQDVRRGAALHRNMTTEEAHSEGHGDAQRWAWMRSCPCDGPTRPGVIALHRLVGTLADLPHPRFRWPDEWIVRADEIAEAGGWMATWWRVFAEWTLRGKEPDEEVLAPMLAALIPELEAREKVKRAKRMMIMVGTDPYSDYLEWMQEPARWGLFREPVAIQRPAEPVTDWTWTGAGYSIEEVREAQASIDRGPIPLTDHERLETRGLHGHSFDQIIMDDAAQFGRERPRQEATFLDDLARQFAEPVKASMTKAFEELAKLDDDDPPDDAEPSPGPHPLTRRGRGRW